MKCKSKNKSIGCTCNSIVGIHGEFLGTYDSMTINYKTFQVRQYQALEKVNY